MISWALWGGAAVPGRRLLLPAQLLGGGAVSPKIGPSPRTPLQEAFPGGAALLAAPGMRAPGPAPTAGNRDLSTPRLSMVPPLAPRS